MLSTPIAEAAVRRSAGRHLALDLAGLYLPRRSGAAPAMLTADLLGVQGDLRRGFVVLAVEQRLAAWLGAAMAVRDVALMPRGGVVWRAPASSLWPTGTRRWPTHTVHPGLAVVYSRCAVDLAGVVVAVLDCF